MKTFNKKRAVKFAFHDPFSSSISCYFDDFSPRKVINFYHQIIIQLINTFQPLFDKLFRYFGRSARVWEFREFRVFNEIREFRENSVMPHFGA